MIGKARDGDGDPAIASGAQCRLGGGRRRQPLFRRRGALGAGQDRSGAAGHRALRDRGSVAAGRDPGAAVHAGFGGEIARSPGGAGRRARFRVPRRRPSHRRRQQSCRRRRRCFRVMSSRRRARRNSHADRQPLPSRFSRFFSRARCRDVARAQAAGIARMVTISTRVAPPCRGAGDRRALSRRLLLGRHPSASRPRGSGRDRDRPRRADAPSQGRRARRSRARLPLRQFAARGAGARLSHPYRRGARDRVAAGHSHPRSRRRHRADPRRGDGAGRLPRRAALLYRRPRPGACAQSRLGFLSRSPAF